MENMFSRKSAFNKTCTYTYMRTRYVWWWNNVTYLRIAGGWKVQNTHFQVCVPEFKHATTTTTILSFYVSLGAIRYRYACKFNETFNSKKFVLVCMVLLSNVQYQLNVKRYAGYLSWSGIAWFNGWSHLMCYKLLEEMWKQIFSYMPEDDRIL